MGRVRGDGEHDSKAVDSSNKKVKRSILSPSTPLRRSGRLNGKSNDFPSSTRDPLIEKDKTEEDNRSTENEQSRKNKARENGSKVNNEKRKKMRLELGTPPRRSEQVIAKPCDSDSLTSQVELEDNSEIVENCSKVPSTVEGGAKMSEPVSEISNDENIQLARISENKAILASFGLSDTIRKLEKLIRSPKTTQKEVQVKEEPKTDDQVTKISDYESIRNARISENKARLESLGIARSIKEFETLVTPTKTSTKRSYTKKVKSEFAIPTRRSSRFKRTNSNSDDSSSLQALSYESDGFIDFMDRKRYTITERCSSKARGSIYDPVIGICCHFCRQKKLCGEEDCKRCGDRDLNQPCIGKTDCSSCHSTNGILCRACLKVRYGEEMEEARSKADWMCPHCIEEKGINRFWICNSSFCLKRRKMVPTGIAIYQARAEGFKSVAHLIMDKLQKKEMAL